MEKTHIRTELDMEMERKEIEKYMKVSAKEIRKCTAWGSKTGESENRVAEHMCFL